MRLYALVRNAAFLLAHRQNARPPTPPRHSLREWEEARTRGPITVQSTNRSFDEANNRDRGEPRGSSPPTPPDIRVRIRRFGGLSEHLFPQEG